MSKDICENCYYKTHEGCPFSNKKNVATCTKWRNENGDIRSVFRTKDFEHMAIGTGTPPPLPAASAWQPFDPQDNKTWPKEEGEYLVIEDSWEDGKPFLALSGWENNEWTIKILGNTNISHYAKTTLPQESKP